MEIYTAANYTHREELRLEEEGGTVEK
jgi:hypothetical protein